jgi:hypothetical protein
MPSSGRYSEQRSTKPSRQSRYCVALIGMATSWTVRGSNPAEGEIFRSRQDRPWGPPSLLYNGYLVSFLGVKRPGRGVDHPPSSARVNERVELYLSPSGPLWPVLGRTLPLFKLYQNQRTYSTTYVCCYI